ncbi:MULTISPECIES: hypothetical protein [Treponema]|uniref:Uncharacterized protein n=1 Tax=Treponema saccharophilum DSM 2985 TaxID=907348 RepID=H7ENB1_9SPIR|nr:MULTISPECIES: hypothetical protein [Treponema]EIC00839.1 hypothetical protein TresaDRAFT_0664 [Treponema saccharophilum DSM 2985]MBQ5538090.1 hypothetical protein [Treponema sp.]BDC95241.1 hypothetical protein TRSA_03400 [Treponema saccharophilum]
MKTALKLIIAYILMCVCGVAFCGFFFMVCGELNFFVAGSELEISSFNLFIKGMSFSIPGICTVAQLMLILYVIRHPESPIHALVVYILIGCATWCLAFPKLISFSAGNGIYTDTRIEQKQLSAGYFRRGNRGIFYYSKVRENGNADGIFIDEKKSDDIVSLFQDKNTYQVSAYPYSDVLIRDAVEPPKIVSVPLGIYRSLMDVAKEKWAGGKMEWLSFASLGFVLLSIYGLQFFSMWNLVNSIVVIFTALVVILLDYIVLLEKLPGIPSGAGGKIALVMNIVLFALFVVYGFSMKLYRICMQKQELEQE